MKNSKIKLIILLLVLCSIILMLVAFFYDRGEAKTSDKNKYTYLGDKINIRNISITKKSLSFELYDNDFTNNDDRLLFISIYDEERSLFHYSLAELKNEKVEIPLDNVEVGDKPLDIIFNYTVPSPQREGKDIAPKQG